MEQIAILACGFDFRHYRLRPKNGRAPVGQTSLFELDIAPTQEAKKDILKRPNCARLVKIDGYPKIAYAKLDLGKLNYLSLAGPPGAAIRRS